ncbi:hypothetical protein CATRI_00220 [Corynebacterium atrinae]|uniref:hypothetical protein n=1 Tax=Corynebacterium atrinae TaxID=1336740 RepID=UPI0025B4731E|nr:hypothetical protein [Corynebacterium atrinae]WJY62167.1 hypothetical protein CATRI_00220 [Corynebacterium atrinae]
MNQFWRRLLNVPLPEILCVLIGSMVFVVDIDPDSGYYGYLWLSLLVGAIALVLAFPLQPSARGMLWFVVPLIVVFVGAGTVLYFLLFVDGPIIFGIILPIAGLSASLAGMSLMARRALKMKFPAEPDPGTRSKGVR